MQIQSIVQGNVFSIKRTNIKIYTRDFPGGSVVIESALQCKEHGSILSQGTKTSQAAGQLNPLTLSTEPHAKLESMRLKDRSHMT